MPKERCDNCDADLTAGQYSKVIGVEIPGVYDGVLYWECPYCWYAWPRVFGSLTLDHKSTEAALTANQRRGVQEALQEPPEGALSP